MRRCTDVSPRAGSTGKQGRSECIPQVTQPQGKGTKCKRADRSPEGVKRLRSHCDLNSHHCIQSPECSPLHLDGCCLSLWPPQCRRMLLAEPGSLSISLVITK